MQISRLLVLTLLAPLSLGATCVRAGAVRTTFVLEECPPKEWQIPVQINYGDELHRVQKDFSWMLPDQCSNYRLYEHKSGTDKARLHQGYYIRLRRNLHCEIDLITLNLCNFKKVSTLFGDAMDKECISISDEKEKILARGEEKARSILKVLLTDLSSAAQLNKKDAEFLGKSSDLEPWCEKQQLIESKITEVNSSVPTSR